MGSKLVWRDPIVDEVRRVRNRYAARFDYDLWAMYRDLKQKERNSDLKVVMPPSRKPTRGKRRTSETVTAS